MQMLPGVGHGGTRPGISHDPASRGLLVVSAVILVLIAAAQSGSASAQELQASAARDCMLKTVMLLRWLTATTATSGAVQAELVLRLCACNFETSLHAEHADQQAHIVVLETAQCDDAQVGEDAAQSATGRRLLAIEDSPDYRCRAPVAPADKKYCAALLRTLARCRRLFGRFTLRCNDGERRRAARAWRRSKAAAAVRAGLVCRVMSGSAHRTCRYVCHSVAAEGVEVCTKQHNICAFFLGRVPTAL